MELFGEMFQNLPRLHTGFLNTSWQTHRNILPPKTHSKDISTPNPVFSPRSKSLLHSPYSQSLYTHRDKSSSPASSKSKSKELPSPLLSPKYITKHKPKAATAKKALHDKLSSSPSPPKQLCSPARPRTHAFNKSLSEEHPTSPQAGMLYIFFINNQQCLAYEHIEILETATDCSLTKYCLLFQREKQ